MGAPEALAISMVASAGSKVASGISSYRSGQATQAAAKEQAHITMQEVELESKRKATEFQKFNAIQRLAFLKSGVSMLGTPTAVQRGNVVTQAQELKSIKVSGYNRAQMFKFQGSVAANQGRARLLGGIMSAGASTALTYAQGTQLGLFGPNSGGGSGVSNTTAAYTPPQDPAGKSYLVPSV